MRPLTEDLTFFLLWAAETTHGAIHVGPTTTMPEAVRHGDVVYTHRTVEDLRSATRKCERLVARGYFRRRKEFFYDVTDEGRAALESVVTSKARNALAGHTIEARRAAQERARLKDEEWRRARASRKAICGACGSEREVTSAMRRDPDQQFQARPAADTDLFYCGCQNDEDYEDYGEAPEGD